MDGKGDPVGGAATVAVVRRFAPSRIERQLLVQAFELVCGWRDGTPVTARTDREGDGDARVASPLAGRQAA